MLAQVNEMKQVFALQNDTDSKTNKKALKIKNDKGALNETKTTKS
jgi:hypothetical protein